MQEPLTSKGRPFSALNDQELQNIALWRYVSGEKPCPTKPVPVGTDIPFRQWYASFLLAERGRA